MHDLFSQTIIYKLQTQKKILTIRKTLMTLHEPETVLYRMYWNGKKSYPIEKVPEHMKVYPWIEDNGRLYKMKDNLFQIAYEKGDKHAVQIFGAMVPSNKKQYFTNLMVDKKFTQISILDYANDDIIGLLVSDFEIPIGGVRIPIAILPGFRY